MSKNSDQLLSKSTTTDVRGFLAKVEATKALRRRAARGRLLFALDATASREPTWDRACQLQAEMFSAAASLGGLEIQLCYYRGFHEFETSPWLGDSATLLARMTGITCAGGMTQIARVLGHTAAEGRKTTINALVLVGDCMEENLDRICVEAGKLALLRIPAFMFLEGDDPAATRAFREVARITHGACCRFNSGSARQLRDLLGAVAVYAAGGRRALEHHARHASPAVAGLVHQLAPGAKS